MTDTLTRGAANQAGAHINKNAYAEAQDFLPIKGIDYVEFWVGNARQASAYYRALWGFTPVAFSGLETKVRDRASYLIVENDIRFVLTAPLTPEGEIAEHVHRHGDGVQDIAFLVDDVRARGARRRRAARSQCWSRPSSTAARTACCASRPSARTARSSTRSSIGATTTACSRRATARSRSRRAPRPGCRCSRSTTAWATSSWAT